MKKININDPKAWQELDWSEPVQPEALKKTDAAVNRVRGAFIKKDNPAFKQKMKQVFYYFFLF